MQDLVLPSGTSQWNFPVGTWGKDANVASFPQVHTMQHLTINIMQKKMRTVLQLASSPSGLK